jgi:hypothetical protein
MPGKELEWQKVGPGLAGLYHKHSINIKNELKGVYDTGFVIFGLDSDIIFSCCLRSLLLEHWTPLLLRNILGTL